MNMKTLRRQSAAPDPSFLMGKAVCLVEDDPGQVDIIRAMLLDSGSRLEAFTACEPALDWLMRTPVDLILCDVMMPGLDGWELHARIRGAGPNAGTPFIFTTCVINKNQEPLMSDLRARTLSLAKPFDKPTLLRTIRRLLG
jgi:CheY-like chemotaxis protein